MFTFQNPDWSTGLQTSNHFICSVQNDCYYASYTSNAGPIAKQIDFICIWKYMVVQVDLVWSFWWGKLTNTIKQMELAHLGFGCIVVTNVYPPGKHTKR